MSVSMVFATADEMAVAGGAWDREWSRSFGHSLTDALLPATEWTRAPVGDIRNIPAEGMFSTVLAVHGPTKSGTPCELFLPGSSIAGRRVVEIGSGYGWLGRQLAPWTSRYLGIDSSRLSLCVAQAVRGPRMRYAHIADQALFHDLRGTFDTLVSRNTFFHLNRAHALGALVQGRRLLRPGSLAVVDFCTIRPGTIAGLIYDCDAPFDHLSPTCGYYFTPSQIEELANAAGFDIEAVKQGATNTHCYVRLRMR